MRISIDEPPANPFADPVPGQDGWRSPTIEDAHHPRNLEMHRSHTSQLSEKSRAPPEVDGVHHRRTEARPSASTRRTSSATFDQHGDNHASAEEPVQHLSIRQRIKHVTWAWFTIVMATGGVASTLRAGRPARPSRPQFSQQQFPSASLVYGPLASSSSWPISSSMSSSGP